MSNNIVLDYPVSIRIDDQVFQCRNGAEVFMDEHGVQWVKFIPGNGYAAGSEHMVQTVRTIIVRTNQKAKAQRR
jgi:hypothetical protein